ncbi:MAG: NFYB/HAP3 family transcription factor subunit [Candidatus Aenigmarchaeota archaeon]|nr:NFYB/HAP3 family transcription factor subunit [Candidatus Aenigmarchaeota archaeon]
MVKEFPLAPLEKIMRQVGAKRVSNAALLALRDCVLEKGEEIARDAIAASRHAKRVTIKASDIKLVTR